MNKGLMKKTSALMLAVLLTFSVTACGKKFDAAAYTKSVLDANYQQNFTEYAEFCKITEDEAKEELQKTIDEQVEAELTGLSSLGEFTDEEKQEYKDLLMEVNKLAKYEVQEATEDEDGNFTVTISITPANVFQTLEDNSTAIAENMVKEGLDITDASTFQKLLIQSLQKSLDENEYNEATSIEISVAKDSNNQYGISDSDLQLISDTLFPTE